ncbi:MAG: SRPBCC domain-containing protein [Specibacter sp.]
MRDMMKALTDVTRSVRTAQLGHRAAVTVVLQQELSASAGDVWAACTAPERISQWFLPVTGDLRDGGNFALDGNASGDILDCTAPRSFRISWVFGEGPHSELEVRLTATNTDHTLFELDHTVPAGTEMLETYGTGAVGVGWDQALVGLDDFLRGLPTGPVNPLPPEVMNPFTAASSRAWADAAIANGTDPEAARAAAARTTAFYTEADDAGPS